MSEQPRLRLTLRIWRQAGPERAGGFENHRLDDLSPDLSLLEALDRLNDRLVASGRRPVGFDHDCREGICGSCGFLVDGQAHGPLAGTTVCQLHLRHLRDGATLLLEPFRARAFPVLQDLAVDRSAFDRIIAAGGYCSVNVGAAPDADAILVRREAAAAALDAASCIGCGACVAACPNASATLFVAAKLAHLGLLPQGQPERGRRRRALLERMAAEGFGGCSNQLECAAACPKDISADWISWMNRERWRRDRIG